MDPIGGDGNRNTLHALPASPLHPFPSSRGNCDLDEGGDGSLNIQPICLSRFVGREEWGEGGCFKIRGNFFTEFAPVLIPIIGIRCTAEVVSRIGWKIGWNRLLSPPPPSCSSYQAEQVVIRRTTISKHGRGKIGRASNMWRCRRELLKKRPVKRGRSRAISRLYLSLSG